MAQEAKTPVVLNSSVQRFLTYERIQKTISIPKKKKQLALLTAIALLNHNLQCGSLEVSIPYQPSSPNNGYNKYDLFVFLFGLSTNDNNYEAALKMANTKKKQTAANKEYVQYCKRSGCATELMKKSLPTLTEYWDNYFQNPKQIDAKKLKYSNINELQYTLLSHKKPAFKRVMGHKSMLPQTNLPQLSVHSKRPISFTNMPSFNNLNLHIQPPLLPVPKLPTIKPQNIAAPHIVLPLNINTNNNNNKIKVMLPSNNRVVIRKKKTKKLKKIQHNIKKKKDKQKKLKDVKEIEKVLDSLSATDKQKRFSRKILLLKLQTADDIQKIVTNNRIATVFGGYCLQIYDKGISRTFENIKIARDSLFPGAAHKSFELGTEHTQNSLLKTEDGYTIAPTHPFITCFEFLIKKYPYFKTYVEQKFVQSKFIVFMSSDDDDDDDIIEEDSDDDDDDDIVDVDGHDDNDDAQEDADKNDMAQADSDMIGIKSDENDISLHAIPGAGGRSVDGAVFVANDDTDKVIGEKRKINQYIPLAKKIKK